MHVQLASQRSSRSRDARHGMQACANDGRHHVHAIHAGMPAKKRGHAESQSSNLLHGWPASQLQPGTQLASRNDGVLNDD
eukprot:1332075-Prorocentrum_lima.AAC.1